MTQWNSTSGTLPGLSPKINQRQREPVIFVPPSDVELVEPQREKRTPSSHPPPPPRFRERLRKSGSQPLRVQGEPEFARDLMTRHLLTIGPNDNLHRMQEFMHEFRFRHLPVVEGNLLVGMISRSDLLELSSSALSKSAPEENAILHGLTASRIMKREVITVRPDEPLVNVSALMWETRVRSIPVTEEDGSLVGIITEGDFLRLAHHYLVSPESAH